MTRFALSRPHRVNLLSALTATGALTYGSAPPPPPPAPPSGAPQAFTLTSSTSGTLPFCIGYPLRQGDVPSGSGIAISGATAQATIKSTWPDGSARFAIIAGTYTSAGSAVSVTPSSGTASTGTALTTADLPSGVRTTGISIGCGSFGTATWTGTDFDSPFQTWVSGHAMSSWIYRKAVGSDAHLVAWLEIRLWASGAVEVLPWIENGYLLVASPTNKSATYTFSLGGTTRFSEVVNLLNHQRTPLVSGTILSHWLSTDPGVTVLHHPGYMMLTEQVPTYYGVTPASASNVTGLPAAFTPLQQGSYPSVMGTTGYSPSIGLLPQWDVLYLTCQTSTLPWAALQRNAYSAGRYGIHFRDETTNKPLRFSSYPNLVASGGDHGVTAGASSTGYYTPTATGGAAPAYKISHHPSLGYMAYLVTGRFYHLETVQFTATLNFLAQTNTQRQFTAGVILPHGGTNTPRGAAWAIRTLAQAYAITPDSDVLRSEFANSIASNTDYLHGVYIAQPNNEFGLTQPYGDTNTTGIYVSQPWMDNDFPVMAWGYLKCLQPALSSGDQTKLDAFFAWKARGTVGRCGGAGATEYLYRDAARVEMAFAPSDTVDFLGGTGPWYANWGAIYDATMNPANGMTGGYPGPKEIGDGSLRGGNFPDASSYWGNLMPALAYAVRHGVSGAADGLNRIRGALNWLQLEVNFNATPEWGVRPSNDRPNWVLNLPLWQWYEIPNTKLSDTPPTTPGFFGDPANKIRAWSGMTIQRVGSKVRLGPNGGHSDYAGNEINLIALNSETPTWVEERASSALSTVYRNSPVYSDLRPAAQHAWWSNTFLDRPDYNRHVMFCRGGISDPAFPAPPSGWPYPNTDAYSKSFNPATGDYDPPEFITVHPTIGSNDVGLFFKHQYTQDCYVSPQYDATTGWSRWTASTNTWTKLSSTSGAPWYSAAAVDPTRNRVLTIAGAYRAKAGVFDLSGSSISVTWTGNGLAGWNTAYSDVDGAGYPGLDYDIANDLFVGASNAPGNVIELTGCRAGDWYVYNPPVTGTKPANKHNGVNSTFLYSSELRGFILLNKYDGNLYFIRTSY